MSYAIYSSDHDKFLYMEDLPGGTRWYEHHRTRFTSDQADLMGKIYLGRAHESMKEDWWSSAEWSRLVNAICDCRNPVCNLFVVPLTDDGMAMWETMEYLVDADELIVCWGRWDRMAIAERLSEG